MGTAIDDPVSHFLDCFRQRGACNYGKEAVTQQKHALQAAFAAYFAKLSPPSVHSLALQGGPMTATQAAHFEKAIK